MGSQWSSEIGPPPGSKGRECKESPGQEAEAWWRERAPPRGKQLPGLHRTGGKEQASEARRKPERHLDVPGDSPARESHPPKLRLTKLGPDAKALRV